MRRMNFTVLILSREILCGGVGKRADKFELNNINGFCLELQRERAWRGR